MRYDIRLTIAHDYAAPVGYARHLVLVTPAHLPPRQILLSQSLEVTPEPAESAAQLDFFGNLGTMVTHIAPHPRMEITMMAQIQCDPVPEGLNFATTLPDLADELDSLPSLLPGAPQHFLGVSPRIKTDAAITVFARETAKPWMDVRDIVVAMGERINRDFDFVPGATTVETPASEAFAARRGVCQDFTHVMITGLRALGIPAAYVSGYLRTTPPPGQARLEGADAMHAWVRAWCGKEIGWIEYDPTNAIFAGQDHIVVAYGRDYGDISPVRGVLRMSGDNLSTQSVDVIPLDAD
ncbi:MAG: transglutaminase family protein [Rhodobacteraceae bacterium]|nr:transglutaminase family protein [Paracoccaceae bacterium]